MVEETKKREPKKKKRLTCKQRHIRRRLNKDSTCDVVGIDTGFELTKEQVWKVLDYCRKEVAKGGARSAITLVLIESYLYTGLRASELLGLQIRDLPGFNGKSDLLRVPATFAKGGKQRTISVSDTIIEKWGVYLKRFHRPTLKLIASKNERTKRRGMGKPFILNERYEQMEYPCAYQRLKRVAKNTGVKISPQILGNVARNGFVQGQLGHGSPAKMRAH